MTKWFRLVMMVLLVGGLASVGVRADGWPTIKLEMVTTGLTSPVHVTHAGDGSGRLFVVEQPGRIRIVRDGVLDPVPFLDIVSKVSSGGERGLLSVAFAPDYAENGRFYVYYTDLAGDSVLSRFLVSVQDGDVANVGSEEVLLQVDQPYANHNGGQLAFGPDGYLYLGLGDGGSSGDPGNRAQNPATLLGKLLRLDVEGVEVGYGIPADNPYVGTVGYLPEIWALGLRNPWRFSFDRLTGDLYIADVGQGDYEEIDVQPADSQGGENYGWRILEGFHCYNPATGCVPPDRYAAPILEQAHSDGWRSITGGFVYRGPMQGDLQGVYLFADYVNGQIWGARQSAGQWASQMLVDTRYSITSFGEDEQGRVYVMDHEGVLAELMDALPYTVTPTASATATPTMTPIPTASPTLTLAPTLTRTATVLPTATTTPTVEAQTICLPLVLKGG